MTKWNRWVCDRVNLWKQLTPGLAGGAGELHVVQVEAAAQFGGVVVADGDHGKVLLTDGPSCGKSTRK